MKKKRTKKYRPKNVYANPLIFSAMPEITKERLDTIEMSERSRVRQAQDGTAGIDVFCDLGALLKSGYVHAVAFEGKSDIQAMFLVAEAACHVCAQLLTMKAPIPPEVIKPIETAVDIQFDMLRSASQKEINDVMMTTAINQKKIMKLSNGAGFLFAPNCSNPYIEGKRGVTFINGRLRTGYVARNEEFQRYEWVDPIDETKVPITEYIVIVLAEPINLNKVK